MVADMDAQKSFGERKKKVKVHNLLSELARQGEIRNMGSRRYPQWQVADESVNQTKDGRA